MRRPILLLLLLLLPACTSWQPVTLPAPSTKEWSVEGRLRITTHWGDRLRADSARLSGDTLLIRIAADPAMAVARSRIATVERHGFDRGKTVGLGMSMAMISFFFSLMAADIEAGLGGQGAL